MSHWLAMRRTVQQSDTIQRFDPRFLDGQFFTACDGFRSLPHRA
jgi:hypothetical protein